MLSTFSSPKLRSFYHRMRAREGELFCEHTSVKDTSLRKRKVIPDRFFIPSANFAMTAREWRGRNLGIRAWALPRVGLNEEGDGGEPT